ncbi:MAG: hypothetical protein GX364_05645 [Firmicutes bacterium]|nr:hypothetical protein [Bacillota bacterium]
MKRWPGSSVKLPEKIACVFLAMLLFLAPLGAPVAAVAAAAVTAPQGTLATSSTESADGEKTAETRPGKEFVDSLDAAYCHARKGILRVFPDLEISGLLSLLGIQKEREEEETAELVHDELTRALQALNDSILTVLRDEDLAEALDEILWEMLDEDNFLEGVQKHKYFIADIIRDERIIYLIGDVIAEMLKDERLVEDIEFFFSLLFDLLGNERIHGFLQETIARLIEDERTSNLLDHIMLAGARIAYETTTGFVGDLTSDRKVKGLVDDFATFLISPLPGMVAQVIGDRRVRGVAADLMLTVLEYGPEAIADLLDDPHFHGFLGDTIIAMANSGALFIADSVSDEHLVGLVDGFFANVSAEVKRGTFTNSIGTMVDDFFQCDEFRDFVDPAFIYMKGESIQRAKDRTVGDTLVLPGIGLKINIMREIARGLAEVPPDIAHMAFLTWMVYGHREIGNRTFGQIVRDIANLLSPELVDDLGEAVTGILKNALPRAIDENRDEIVDALENFFADIPYEELADLIRENDDIDESLQMLVEALFAHLPLDALADVIRGPDTVAAITGITGSIIDNFPLKEIGEFIEDDVRIWGIIRDALVSLPTDELAAFVREEERVTAFIQELLADFPVSTISGFLQGGERADIIGYNVAAFLLNIVADFVEEEDLTDFAYMAICNILESFDEPLPKSILGLLAIAFENEEVAPYLAKVLVGFATVTRPDVHAIYKQYVPNVFTRIIVGADR